MMCEVRLPVAHFGRSRCRKKRAAVTEMNMIGVENNNPLYQRVV